MAKSSIIICLIVGLALICIVDSMAFSNRDLGKFKKLQNKNFTDFLNLKTFNTNASSSTLPHGNLSGKSEVLAITYASDSNKIDGKSLEASPKIVQKQSPGYYGPSTAPRRYEFQTYFGSDSNRIDRKNQLDSQKVVQKRNPDYTAPTYPTWYSYSAPPTAASE